MEVHKQYNLRSKKSVDSATQKPVATATKKHVDVVTKKTQTDTPSTSQWNDNPQKYISKKLDFVNLDKTQTNFSIENELSKLKIIIPLTEIINKNM